MQFAAAYIATIKPRNDNEFISMSEQAGAPPGRERGMITAGVRFTPSKALSFGAINYYVPDTWNIFYTEGNYTWPLTDKLGLKLQAQFTEQDSVGGDNLIGSFQTRVGGLRRRSVTATPCSGRRFPSRRTRRTSRAHTVPILAICR